MRVFNGSPVGLARVQRAGRPSSKHSGLRIFVDHEIIENSVVLFLPITLWAIGSRRSASRTRRVDMAGAVLHRMNRDDSGAILTVANVALLESQIVGISHKITVSLVSDAL